MKSALDIRIRRKVSRSLLEPRSEKEVPPIYASVESLIGFEPRLKTRVTKKLHFANKLLAFGTSIHEQRQKWLEADLPARNVRKLFAINRLRRLWLGTYQPRNVWRRALLHSQLSRSVIEMAQARIDEEVQDKDAVVRILSDQDVSDVGETTRIVRLRARATKLDVPERRVASEQVTNELAACAVVFETNHRHNVNEASKLFDRFRRGKVDDKQPASHHLFQKQLSSVRRNRLNLASVEAQLSNKDADIPPVKRLAAQCDAPLSLQHQEWLEEAFLAAASSSAGDLDEKAKRKKRQQKLLGEVEEEATGKDAELSKAQFGELCRLLAPRLRLTKEMTSHGEIQRLFKIAASGSGASKNEKASLVACTRTFATVAETLPLIELRITDANQHCVEVSWTWNGLPELHKDHGHWEAKVESSLIFVLEVARLNAAYGIRSWHQAAPPTRRLEARALLAGKLTWEEYGVDAQGHDAFYKISGVPEQYCFRVLAKTRGGLAPPSNIVMHRAKHCRTPIMLELPGPLPPFVRGILDIEDCLRKEEKATGLTADEQFEPLLAALGRHTFELSQLFRLFAVAGEGQPRNLFSFSSKQFRGFVAAIGLAPQVISFRSLDTIFTRSQRITKGKIDAAANKRTAGGPDEQDEDELGFTQFLCALLRVANASYTGRVAGMQAQFDSMMEKDVLPLHQRIANPNLFDRFLRSRPAVCVYHEHTLAMRDIFDLQAKLQVTSRHAFTHVSTMNVSEWLALLSMGGYFAAKSKTSSAEHVGHGQFAAVLTRLRAIRIFAEINLDDVSLDVVETDEVHLHKVYQRQAETDLFAELSLRNFVKLLDLSCSSRP